MKAVEFMQGKAFSHFNDLAKLAGLPDKPGEELTCVDCGETKPGYGFRWDVDAESFFVTGPRCGCVPIGKASTGSA